MRLISLQKSLIAANAALIAASQTPVSGTALTLTGVQPDNMGRRILLTFGNEASNRTLVLTGTNSAGTTITETLSVTSGASGTVASLQDFSTIASALPLGGGWTAAVTLGTNTVGSTQWFVPSQHITPFELTILTRLVSGTANWSIEVSYQDVKATVPLYGSTQQPPPIVTPYGLASMTGLTSDAAATVRDTLQGWRLTINSGTGTVEVDATQAGLRQ